MTAPLVRDGTGMIDSSPRLRIGGWAALVVAVLAPLRLVALFASAGDPGPFAAPAVLALELLGLVATGVALTGLVELLQPLAPTRWSTISVVALLGLAMGVAGDALALAGDRGAAAALARLAGTGAAATWFVGAGLVLMAGGRQLARIGWTATLGGLAMLLSAIAVATSFGGPVGTGRSWIDWFELASLFVVVFLVRTWQYVVRGRLPGPGIL